MKTKYCKNAVALAALTSLLVATAQGEAQASKKMDRLVCNFEQVPAGQLPAGWKVETTNLKGELAVWKVIEDSTAPFGKNVLAMTNPNLAAGDTFNLCWTDTVSFLDGEIEVRFKAVTGEEDQGGGVIWRAQDKNNYYIARFNPEEDNFRIYYVRDSNRERMATLDIVLAPMKWHTLKIVQRGNRYEGYLNGEKLLEGTDDLFAKPGGVGLWTKADAVTSFDGFSVSPAKKNTSGASQP
ncbi:MAG: hypothetical protein DRP64_08640 [Verrucomicrobia bacterium]|nr:MAG: hypothetical protein DRP64_08640 [Verrucomicrobiota bacterium]